MVFWGGDWDKSVVIGVADRWTSLSWALYLVVFNAMYQAKMPVRENDMIPFWTDCDKVLVSNTYICFRTQ